ncbi:MAG: sigma-70 family RNA polymerase sigma factor [Planctomycetes bacterium]|nr:sigma-70 family RNA polymerase sigma factor [Planctomycetota bacterium]
MTPNASQTSPVPSGTCPAQAEAALLLRLRRREREALTGLVETYGGLLARTAWVVLGDAHAAEDAVQETLLAAWDAARRKREGASLRAWLLGILVNRCRKHIRAAARRRRREQLAARSEAAAVDATGDDGDLQAVREALARLEGRLRDVVILRYWQGLSVDQTAAALGVPSGTVKSRCHAAIEKLRETMRPG